MAMRSKMKEVIDELERYDAPIKDVELKRLIITIAGVSTGRSIQNYVATLKIMGKIKYDALSNAWIVNKGIMEEVKK